MGFPLRQFLGGGRVVRDDKGGGGAAVARGKRGFWGGGERWQMPIRVKIRMGYIKTQRFERQFSIASEARFRASPNRNLPPHTHTEGQAPRGGGGARATRRGPRRLAPAAG